MPLFKHISYVPAFIVWIGLTGCIHTYPSPEGAIDPTEIEATLLLRFDEEWAGKDFIFQETKGYQFSHDTRADRWPRRIYAEIKESSGKRHSFSTVAMPEEIVEGSYRLELPFKLKADSYIATLWADCLDPTTLQPLGYDISNTSLIKELAQRGEESDRRTCVTAIQEIDLRHLAGEWDSKVEQEITLTTPMARFRLIADDYQEFLQETEEVRRRGEKYQVTVEYNSEIPGGFSLLDGEAMDPVNGRSFSSPLTILTFPGIEMSIGSDWLFNPPGEYMHTVTVTVFNSAKAIVSQTPGITFPMQRGHITTVKGKMLTNFIKGGIQIDNIWAGEIIIEI